LARRYFRHNSARSKGPRLPMRPGGSSPERHDGSENSRRSHSQSAGCAKSTSKQHLRLVTPAIANGTVTPKRRPNADLRTREYLTEAGVERLMNVAKGNRWGHRDATMVLVAYRHGLRASEVVNLRWEQIEFRTASLHIRRAKQGTRSSTHYGETSYGPCGATARTGPQFRLRFHIRARRAVQHGGVRAHSGAGRQAGQTGFQGSPLHASPCLRLRAGQ
jgi:hypothetical protein